MPLPATTTAPVDIAAVTTCQTSPWSQHRAWSTSIVRDLVASWPPLARSRRFRRSLAGWAVTEPCLAAPDGVVLLDRAQGDAASDVLAALSRLAAHGDDLAIRTAVQLLLPRLAHIVDEVARVADRDELMAAAVATAIDQLVACRPHDATTAYVVRLYRNIRRQVVRSAHRSITSAARRATPADLEALTDTAGAVEFDAGMSRLVEDLKTRGLSHTTATTVVATRVGGWSIDEVAAALHVGSDTVRRRRHRGEQALAARLAA